MLFGQPFIIITIIFKSQFYVIYKNRRKSTTSLSEKLLSNKFIQNKNKERVYL